jgi:hypothetical protein
MEPTDLDKIIQNKLKEYNTAHQQEMEKAKPFVWSAIQREMEPRKSMKWYHLAAAVLLLLISFTFVLQSVRKSHESELMVLSSKIDKLEQQFEVQNANLNSKNDQVTQLAEELKVVESKFNDVKQVEFVEVSERIVYKTDTVYVKQVEYVTKYEPSTIAKEVQQPLADGALAKNDQRPANIEYAIYPRYSDRQQNIKSEKVKVKFGNLRTISN